jgi:hypothetical protein
MPSATGNALTGFYLVFASMLASVLFLVTRLDLVKLKRDKQE